MQLLSKQRFSTSNIGDLKRFKLSCLGSLVSMLSQNLNYFAFQSCDFERHLKKVIQETHVRTKFDIYVSSLT